MNVSVALAAFNGDQYIENQIRSIASQLTPNDEIIVSDDGSTDNTIVIVENLKREYPQISLIPGPQLGVFSNFENAILRCNNDIIFLSDQDDIWCSKKVEKVVDVFKNNPDINVVLHQGITFADKYNNIIGIIPGSYKNGFVNNWIKSSYWGCCMAFRKNYINKFLPFHRKGVAHDQLIGLFGERDHTVFYLNEKLMFHRIHERNVTKKGNLLQKITFRIKLLMDLFVLYKK